MTTVGDILELAYGKALKESDRDGGEVPVVGSGGVVGRHSTGFTTGPTIVVGRKGSIGNVTWVDGPAWPIDTAYFVAPRSRTLDKRWAYWMLRSLELATMNKSAAVPGLNRDDVYRLRVEVPTADAQRRIAAILDAADAIRTKRRSALDHLGAFTQAVFHAMFGDPSIPEVPAGNLMPEMRNGLSPSTGGTHIEQVLTLSAVTQGAFDPTAVKVGTFSVAPPIDKRVNASDFLICRGNGNKKLVGVGAFSATDRPDLVFPDTVIAGRVDTSLVARSYLHAAWHQPRIRRQIEAVARTTNGTYKVNQQALASVLVPLPSREDQHEFARRAAAIDAERARVQRALFADNELFASLQSRAFGGGSGA